MVALPLNGFFGGDAGRAGVVPVRTLKRIPFIRNVSFVRNAPGQEPASDEPIRLTPDQVEEFGRALDEIRERVLADLGERDRKYIYNVIRAQRALESTGRGLFFLGFVPPIWCAAVASLTLSKIIDNLEIGHNVMHGQYDFMREHGLNSRVYEWDMVVQGDLWRYSHNYRHHTYTNVIGQDRDIGFGVMRMDDEQPWHPVFLLNPVIAGAIVLFFEWLATLHVLELDHSVLPGDHWKNLKKVGRHWWAKIAPQVAKDYVFFPALTGPLFPLTFAGNATANLIRNLWVGNLIYCGHFPTGAQTFTEAEISGETRGEWYLRQLLGSANYTGSRLLHILAGSTGFQIEHHLFPDLPSCRLPEISREVQHLCDVYGLPYNTGPLPKQLFSAWKKIVKLGLPQSWVTPDRVRTVIVERKTSQA